MPMLCYSHDAKEAKNRSEVLLVSILLNQTLAICWTELLQLKVNSGFN